MNIQAILDQLKGLAEEPTKGITAEELNHQFAAAISEHIINALNAGVPMEFVHKVDAPLIEVLETYVSMYEEAN